MEAFTNYLTEIQSANVSKSVGTPPLFAFNNVKDYHTYQQQLRNLEFNFIGEYLSKITTEKILWERIYTQYLQQTKDCFRHCEKGNIHHRNFHIDSVLCCEATETMFDEACIHTQAFMHLQFESISRTHMLITDQQGGATSSYR